MHDFGLETSIFPKTLKSPFCIKKYRKLRPIKIQLGGNFTRKNYGGFPRLLDYLLEEGITPEKLSFVKFDPVTKIGGEFGLPDFREGCDSINKPWLYEANFIISLMKVRTVNLTQIAVAFCG